MATEFDPIKVNVLKEIDDSWYIKHVEEVKKYDRKFYDRRLVGDHLFFRNTHDNRTTMVPIGKSYFL